MGNPDDKQQTN